MLPLGVPGHTAGPGPAIVAGIIGRRARGRHCVSRPGGGVVDPARRGILMDEQDVTELRRLARRPGSVRGALAKLPMPEVAGAA